jgi:hypothetical protein
LFSNEIFIWLPFGLCRPGHPQISLALFSPVQAMLLVIGLNSVIVFFLLIDDYMELLVDEIRVSNVKLLTECRTSCLVV